MLRARITLGICTHKCEFASSWRKVATYDQHNTNQFNFRCLNFSLDKRIHNSIQQHILRLVYHRIYTDAFYLSLFRSAPFPHTYIHTYSALTLTSMIYVVFNFAKSMRQHRTLCMYGLFVFFLSLSWFFSSVRPFRFLVWLESNLQINEPAGNLYK